MKPHEDEVRLRHMLDYALTARRFVEGRTRSDLTNDELLRLGLTRAIEVIGEAAAKVSKALREAHPDVPWQNIINTRHRLIHGYDAVDLSLLWRIISEDLPPLILQLEHILKE